MRQPHILIAGIGYSFLHDWSVGPRLVVELKKRTWREGVDIDDWSFGPIDGVYRFRAADPPFDRAVFFGAVQRGRPVGTVVCRRWDPAELPDPEVIQERVGEAISGVITLDNMVFVCAAFNALPQEVIVIDVEPDPDDSWGEGYSAVLEAAIPELIAHIEREAGVTAEQAPIAAGSAPAVSQ